MSTIEALRAALIKAWTSREDIAMPGALFVVDEPAAGQCAVTSLVVQDYFGGEILNTVATNPAFPELTSSHYFNVIHGEHIDFTRQQFRSDVVFSTPKPKTEGFASTREYMLSFESTAKRYERLKSRVEKLL